MEQQAIIVDRTPGAEISARSPCWPRGRRCCARRSGPADEVTDLVEQPTVLGDFDPEYLRLPKEVLITVMKKHQRYFPVVDAEGRMMPHFIGVRNGGSGIPGHRPGRHEGVLRRVCRRGVLLQGGCRTSWRSSTPGWRP
jgi:hypothetical protein